MHTLVWRELVLLRCIIELTAATGKPPTQEIAGLKLNKFIADNGVPDWYGLPILPRNTTRLVEKLRDAGLVEGTKRDPLRVSPAGYALDSKLGKNWRDIPTLLVLKEDGTPDFSTAVRL